MSTINFGTVRDVLVFGGTERLVNFVEAASGAYRCHVVTSPRLRDAVMLDGQRLADGLESLRVETDVIDSLGAFDDGAIGSSTLAVSIGAPFIFDAGFIARFEGRFVNAHGNKMPLFRGAGDFSWQILQGIDFGYHVLHLMEAGIDAGDIVFSQEFMFPPGCRTPRDYRSYFVRLEKEFFDSFVAKLARGEDFERTSQQENFSSYFPRLSTLHHGLIDWSWSAGDIERFVCAFDDPYPGASTFLGERRVKLKKVRTTTHDGAFHPFQAGLVYRKGEGHIYVVAGRHGLIVESLLDEDGNDLIAKVRLGDRLHTPSGHLDAARSYRAVYDSKGLKNAP